jgi:photosystem II stability/assembly factor-like uncharacterized protein
MQFVNQNTGWAIVNNSNYVYILLRTTNQGTNWDVVYSDSTKVETFQFINDTLGYAIGFYQGYSLISKTTNSGYNWTVLKNSSEIYGGFYMISKDTGWVNTFRNLQYVTMRTVNGFQSLEDLSFEEGGTPASLYFFREKYNNEHYGYMIGSGILYKTTNSGFNWQQINSGLIGSINCFSFLNKDTGWVVIPYSTASSRIYYTLNGGLNWILQFFTNYQGDFNIIQAVNKNLIFCGSNSSKIYVSTNGGINWGYQTSPIYSNGGIYFYDTLMGFAWSNQIVRTINGGGPILQITKRNEQITKEYNLYQNYPNPFNNATSIKYQISKNSYVSLKLYDILGKEIATLVNEYQTSGIYETNWDASDFSSGIYIYRLTVIEKNNGKYISIFKKLIYSK